MKKEKIKNFINSLLDINVLAIIIFTPLYFAFFQENYSIFELNKIVLFRSLLLLSIILYVAKVFLEGKVRTKINFGLFLFVAFAITSFFVSSYYSIHPKLSFWGSYARQQGFYSLISYVLFFCLLILCFDNFKKIKKAIIAVIASSTIACIYGIIQYFYLDPLNWKEATIFTNRIFSSLGQPNFFGHFLLLTIPLSIYSLFCLSKKFIYKLFLLLIIFGQLACLIFTYSRSALLGFVAGLYVFLVLWLVAKRRKKIAISLILVGFVFCSIIIVGSIFYTKNGHIDDSNYDLNFVSRIKSNFDLSSGSTKMRLLYWQAAVREIKTASPKRLLIGYGPETLSTVFSKYYTPEWGIYEKINSYPDRAHNIIFDTILAFGLFGPVLFFLFSGYLATQIYRYVKINFYKQNKEFWLVLTISALLFGHFINLLFTFSTTAINVYFVLMLAILVFLLNQYNQSKELAIKLTKISRIIIFISVFTVCFLFIFYQNINELLADYYYMEVKLAEKNGDCGLVLDNMEKVINYSPVRTFYQERYLYHYLNCFGANENQEAQNKMHDNLVWMLNTIKSEEYQFFTVLNMAHAESLLGYYINPAYYGAAERNYTSLIQLNPYFTQPAKDFAKMKLWQNDYEQAINYAKQAIDAAPSLDHENLNEEHSREIKKELIGIYDILGAAYEGQDNSHEALIVYENILKIDPFYLLVYKRIADIYYRQGDIGKAIFYNKRGYMLNPRDYAWPYAIALLYQDINDKESAFEYASQAIALSSGNQEVTKLLNEL